MNSPNKTERELEESAIVQFDKLKFLEFFLPDKIDIIVFVIVLALVIFVFGNVTTHGNFNYEYTFIVGLVFDKLMIFYLGLIYFIYACNRWGVYGVDQMIQLQKERAERPLEEIDLDWNLKIFAIVLGALLMIFDGEIASSLSHVLR